MRTKVVAAAAAVALAALALPASTAEPDWYYGFGDCVENERTLYYYTEDSATCTANTTGEVLSKPPVRGLRCDIECERGYYLGANFSGPEPVSGCERCPKGKYSLGGGKLFSQRTGAWSSPLPIELHTDCVTQNMYSGEWVPNCNPWEASADGSMVSSGDNSNVMENFEATRLFSTLRVSATFVRDGSVTYQYRVDAEDPYDGLLFQVDDDAGSPLVSQSDGWKEEVVQVSAGAHSLAWNYMKDYAGDAGEDKAFIKVIEVVGTAFADLHCHTCGGDMTMTGGSLCAFCGANEYSAAKSDSELDFTCYACPPNTFAPKGSIGADSCVEQRACTMDDVVASFTDCEDGARDVTYTWSQPQTCDTSLEDSIELPAAATGVECAQCARGYELTDVDTCEPCALGEKMGANGECEQCPTGQVAVKAIEFGVGTPDAWGSWPSIMDSGAAERAGWKLTQSGLLFAQHTGGNDGSETTWSRPSRSAVTFNVSFQHSGFLNLTYQLSGVPTFADDGARAWLELEIRDAGDDTKKLKALAVSNADSRSGSTDEEDSSVVHLLHGGENGTFNELVPFNLTGPTVKEFALVLRATSAVAKRAVEVKLQYLGFEGTRDGAGVNCDSCPIGYAPVNPDDDVDMYGCQICPAGTFAEAGDATGIVACATCPANTYSSAGVSECTPCGANTFSSEGAVSCAAPQALTLNATASSTSASTSAASAVSSALDGLQVTYNLSLLEALVWGNESWILDDTLYGNASSLQSVDPVQSSEAFQVDNENYLFTGLFRPLGGGWADQIPGQIVNQEVDTFDDLPYVITASMLNPRDAGNYFEQNTGRYGEVLCSAPAQWSIKSGGNHMEISPLEWGAGVKVSFTGGSPCVDDKTMSTTINFECDLNSGTTTKPSSAVQDDDKCNWNIVWKTAYACPVCDDDYFHELRSACNGGEQAVSYASKLACYGGSQPDSTQSISTCSESDVVLDTKTLYSVYVAIVVVGFVVLLLFMGILIIHRKYRNAYNDYLYLKGQMPARQETQDDGSKETVFEFTSSSNALHSSPASSVASPAMAGRTDTEETKPDAAVAAAHADDIELKLQSV